MLKYGGRSAPLSVPCRSYCSNPRGLTARPPARPLIESDGAKLLKAAERHGLAENFYLFRERRFPCESSIARADLALKGAFFLGVLPGRPLPSPRPSASLLAPFASCFPALEALGVGRPICRSGAFSLGRVLGL